MIASLEQSFRELMIAYEWDTKLGVPSHLLAEFLTGCLASYTATVVTARKSVMPPLGRPPWEQRGITREMWELEGRIIALEKRQEPTP